MSKKKEDGYFIELDGRVSLLTRKKGKEKREVLDGETVLKSFLYVLESALDNVVANPPTAKELKQLRKEKRA